MMTEMRGASNAKAKRELGWQPRYPSWREGFAEAAAERCRTTQLLDELRPRGLRDRLPDARQRERGGGRGAGGPPPPPPRRWSGRADRVAARIPGDGGHPARDRPAALGAGAARDLCRRVAARAAGHGRRRRPGAPGRDGRLALARLPGAAGEPVARAAGGASCCATCSTTPTRRSPRSSARARPTRASSPCARGGTWRTAGRASKPRASSARSWPTASSRAAQRGRPRRARGAARRGRRAARRRRRQGAGAGRALFGRARVARTLRQLDARRGPDAAASIRRGRVNGQPGALLLDGEERVISVMALDIADGRVQGIRSIVNPDKLGAPGPCGRRGRPARAGVALNTGAMMRQPCE